jgi:uncharacterized membrane protein
MAKTNQLVLAIFDNEAAADRTVESLKSWDKASEEIKLGGIGVLVKDQKGEIKQAKLGPRRTVKGAGIGLVLGLIFTGPLLAATGGAAIGALLPKGFKVSKEDAQRLDKELSAGHAAVGVMASEQEASMVADKLKQLGGKIETHEVTDEALQAAAQTGEPPATKEEPHQYGP